MVALALFLLPWVAALVLVRRHHHLDAAAVGMFGGRSERWLAPVLADVGGLPGSKASRYTGERPELGQVADQLAVAVGAQWNAEAAIRRLNDPYPLPVSWTAADASLTDAWDSLVKLAISGAGWPAPPPSGTWAAGPDDLAGEGDELVKCWPGCRPGGWSYSESRARARRC